MPVTDAPIVASTDAEPPGFMGRPERELLEQLRNQPLTAARKGSGGRTLAFKVTLAPASRRT
ncbi:MAG TPA: hypothetical protein VHZ95_02785 [Polyangiales bacterium]|nr:hypothetical protein [Polyangiales bacterium]